MLSNLLIQKMKPQAKSERLSDGRGMYLEIAPSGGMMGTLRSQLVGTLAVLNIVAGKRSDDAAVKPCG